MGTTTIRVTTRARYRGLPVTIVGDVNVGLLAVAGYGTAQELAIAAIAVKRRRRQRVYCVAGARMHQPPRGRPSGRHGPQRARRPALSASARVIALS